ncbi:MAG TPA: tetratricopeptide repeat protein [Caulobacteraceae bacterium]|nr:tetratricopeptide repeat protein [Caulobacteraceae bacterium]
MPQEPEPQEPEPQGPEPQGPGGDDAGVDGLLASGLELRRGGDAAAAEWLFRQALNIEPDNATGLYLLGLLRFEVGAPAEAEALIARLAQLRPAHAEAHFTLASIRHWRDDRAAAIAAYRHALQLSPTHGAAQIGLARALAESGEHAASLEAAQAAVQLAPADPAAHLALAAAQRGLGDVKAAITAFSEAVRLAPDLTTAHVGLALALTDAGEPSLARIAAERATTLDPALCDAWLALGSAMRGLHDPAAAAAAFERALALAPERAVVHLNLGLVLIELERADEARACLTRTLEIDPSSATAHANLSSLYYLAGRKSLAKSHAYRALALEPKLMSAHQNLAALLAEEQQHEAARAHRDRAYGERNLVVVTSANPRARVLILSTTESGNTPDRHLIPPANYTRLLWFVEYASEAQLADLPAYDVAFNAIGDEDLAGPTADNARRFAALTGQRLLNHPDKIARTRRDLAGDLFAHIDGLVVPNSVRVEAADVAAGGVREAARRAGVAEPFLVRPIGSHGGKGLALVGGGAPDEPLTAAGAYYLTEFADFRSADGFHRKYRAIFVGGRPLPYHLAISPAWMVHYESAGMEADPARLAEEMRFLEDPAAALGADAWAAVAKVGAAMDLDYAGVDFSLLPDGRVLLFEANATMLVHPEADDGPLAHKNPAIERILTAFQAMLATD